MQRVLRQQADVASLPLVSVEGFAHPPEHRRVCRRIGEVVPYPRQVRPDRRQGSWFACRTRFRPASAGRIVVTMLRRCLAIVITLLLAQVASAQSVPGNYRDSYPKNAGIDILNYAFELRLSDQSDSISGAATIDARFVTAGQRELRLDLIKQSEALGGKGMTVHGVTMDGRPLAFRHERDQVFIDLGRVSQAFERVRVTVTYSGIPAAGLKVGPNRHGDRAFFSDNWSSRVRNWLPAVDHPSDKATSEMIVIAPAHYLVVSNGVLVEETSQGDGTTLSHWKNSVPIAPWLFMLGVADFAVQYVGEFDGKSIQTWVPRQDRDAGFHDFAEPTWKVLDYYSNLIGPYLVREAGEHRLHRHERRHGGRVGDRLFGDLGHGRSVQALAARDRP